jgi:hypothetical protein
MARFRDLDHSEASGVKWLEWLRRMAFGAERRTDLHVYPPDRAAASTLDIRADIGRGPL